MSFMKYPSSVRKLSQLATCMIFAGVLVVTAGCTSPEEKADKFYQNGVRLLKEGDLPKARIEFQNALQIKKDMTAAWYGLAEIAEQQADWDRMLGLLNKVVDRDPKHLEAHLKLGRLFLAAGQLDQAMKFADKSEVLSKNDPSVLALKAAVYLKLENKPEAVKFANAALAIAPENTDALVVLAVDRLAAGDPEKAIEFLDRGLKSNEKNIALQLIKVQAFEKMAKLDSAEAVFKKMITLFPQTKEIRHVLAQFYLTHNRLADAEGEYRAIANENPKDVAARMDVVRFVGSIKGEAAAMSELESFIQKDPGNSELKFAYAGIQQSKNRVDVAEKVYKEVIAAAGDSPDGIKAKALLASSLMTRGDKEAGNILVSEVLAKDARNEQALLLRASVAIDDGRLEDAVSGLRTILKDSPDSPRAHALLAKAHELQGAGSLAENHYARAFQNSKLAAPFGLAYAEFLIRSGKGRQVEDVLKEVLRVSPQNVPALRMLAQYYLSSANLAGAQSVADELGRIENQGVVANQVQGAVFAAKKNFDNSIASFKRAYELSPSEAQPMVALVRTYLRAGKTKEALAFVQSVIDASPNNADARLLQAQLLFQSGNLEGTQQALQSVVELAPKNPAGYQGLINLYLTSKRYDEAGKAIENGLTAIPNDFGMKLSKAGLFEIQSKNEEAISLYEQLLKEKPNSDVVVNNLASLLSDYRTDKASFQRAYDLSARLRKSDIPQMKDTAGWASYRVGKFDEAAALLKSAAEKMPELADIHYHLGMTLLALNNRDKAKESLKRSLEVGKGQPFARADEVKKVLQGL